MVILHVLTENVPPLDEICYKYSSEANFTV